MRIIVVANQKGGVGKTTTAVNLSWGLADRGYKVLLIDMDPQANATLALLGEYPVKSVYDVLIGKETIAKVTRKTESQTLEILPSNIDLSGAEVDLIGKVAGQVKLKFAIEKAKLDYDFVVIDAPPSLGYLAINSLAAADEIIIPISISYFALNGVNRLIETITEIQAGLNNSKLHVLGALMTLTDTTNTTRDTVDEVKGFFGDKVFEAQIPRNVKIEEAHSRRISVFEHAPTSKGAKAYLALVDEVINKNNGDKKH